MIASQRVFPELLKNPNKSAIEVAQRAPTFCRDSSQDSILPIINEVIKEFPLKVEEYKERQERYYRHV